MNIRGFQIHANERIKHVPFRVEFVFAFPPDYKHHQEQIPLEFVEMVKKCPIHTVKVNRNYTLAAAAGLNFRPIFYLRPEVFNDHIVDRRWSNT